jgi:hypothetical protein
MTAGAGEVGGSALARGMQVKAMFALRHAGSRDRQGHRLPIAEQLHRASGQAVGEAQRRLPDAVVGQIVYGGASCQCECTRGGYQAKVVHGDPFGCRQSVIP